MAIPEYIVVTRNNDQYLQIELTDGITNQPINTATVSATVYDRREVIVPFGGGISMPYVAASSGVYRGLLTDKFNPPVGATYKIHISAVDSDIDAVLRLPCHVEERTD